MKKLAIIIFCLLLPTFAFGQANQQVYSRIRDATNPNSLAAVLQFNLTFPTTTYGLMARSGGYFYDIRNLQWQANPGDALSMVDNVLTTAIVPYTGGFLYAYDITGTNWDAVRINAMGTEAVANTTQGLFAQSFGYAYDEANTTWRWLNVQPTIADDMPVSRNALVTYSVMGVYNGATIDMARAGAVGELQVTDVATRPGEDAARDLRKIEVTERKTYSPAKETSGAIDDDPPVVVLAAKEMLSYPNYCVFMKNLDAANSLTDVDHQVSPDNTSWVDLTEPASCDTLAAGAMCVFCVSGNAYRYVRVRALAGAGAADVDSVDVWVTAQK